MMLTGRWQPLRAVATLVCLAVALGAASALPAPPDTSGIADSLVQATGLPITEEELNKMVEQLLMEAYGDDYEPPAATEPPTPSPGAPAELPPQFNHQPSLGIPMQKDFSGLHHQILDQSDDDDLFDRQNHFIQNTSLITDFQEEQVHEQFTQSIHVNLPTVTPTAIRTTIPNTDFPSTVLTSTVPTQHPKLASGIPTADELQEALLVQQENQPKILIVDRRKKTRPGVPEGVPQESSVSNTHLRNFTDTSTEASRVETRETKQDAFRDVVAASFNGRLSLPHESAAVVATESINSLIWDNAPTANRNKRPPPVIQSATLLTHIVSEDSKPFQTVLAKPGQSNSVGSFQALNENGGPTPTPFAINDNSGHALTQFTINANSGPAPAPFTLPNLDNNQSQLGDKSFDFAFDDEDLLLLQLLGSQVNQDGHTGQTTSQSSVSTNANHPFLTQPKPNPHQFTAQPQSNHQQFTVQPQPNSPQFASQSKQNSQHSQNFNANNNRHNFVIASQPTNIPLNVRLSSPHNSFDDDDLTLNLANFGNVGVPTASGNVGNTRTTLPTFAPANNFGAKEIGQRQPPSYTVNSPNSPNSLTVGDLVMSLNGRNGIRVVSLSDLRDQLTSASSSSSQNLNEETILQQLRNAMISENIENLRMEQLTGLVGLDVGVPLPINNQKNNINRKQNVNNAHNNQERQFEFLFGGGENQNSQVGANGGLDDFFTNTNGNAGNDIFSGSTNAHTESVGVPLPATTGGSAMNGDVGVPLPAAVGAAPETNTQLEDNTDFDFSNYDDDLPPLPPQPPNVFRNGISDIFFTKGQWIGTLIGGAFDIGSAVGSSIAKIFNKS